ncbi:hypothetical protein CMN_00275 [Clavibacter nebraskensis NCPPB 2581]|nr:hypothetical protein CMN_00275 [Clavibacter nebraskensis NCPPB 2581]
MGWPALGMDHWVVGVGFALQPLVVLTAVVLVLLAATRILVAEVGARRARRAPVPTTAATGSGSRRRGRSGSRAPLPHRPEREVEVEPGHAVLGGGEAGGRHASTVAAGSAQALAETGRSTPSPETVVPGRHRTARSFATGRPTETPGKQWLVSVRT